MWLLAVKHDSRLLGGFFVCVAKGANAVPLFKWCGRLENGDWMKKASSDPFFSVSFFKIGLKNAFLGLIFKKIEVQECFLHTIFIEVSRMKPFLSVSFFKKKVKKG